MLTRRQVSAGLALLASGRAAFAQTYPDRPIKIMVGYPAGGGVDIVARLLGEPIKQMLGQSSIVENRAGASAMIAAAATAMRRPTAIRC